MGQWAEELADKAKGRLKVLLHHGPKRSKDPKDLAAYDIVLVTYQTLGLDFSRGLKETSGDGRNRFPPCGSIQWHRIVLDEAHTVKNPTAQLTKACMALASNKRLVSTRTCINDTWQLCITVQLYSWGNLWAALINKLSFCML